VARVAHIRALILVVKPEERGLLGVGGRRILHKKVWGLSHVLGIWTGGGHL
jgi:hypothetical protein